MQTNPRIVFMGSPDFAVPTLRQLASQFSVVGVVTQPDRQAGRGRTVHSPPVKWQAIELGIPVMQPERLKQPEAMKQLHDWQPDLIVVAAFGQLLKPDVLNLPPYGCINVHASLLPRWRGAAPINAAILHGDHETGITIMKMDEGLDTGPILSVRSIPIRDEDTAGTLFETLSVLGGELLIETIPAYLAGKIKPQPQPAQGMTYAPMLKKEDGLLDFSSPAQALARKVRAFNPWPGAYFDYNGQMFKVHAAHVAAGKRQAGERLIHQGLPAVAASHGLLVLDEVQPAGKKPMPGRSFIAGARDW